MQNPDRNACPDLDAIARDYFDHQLSLTLEALLAPIDADAPAGRDQWASNIYNAVREARRSEDPSLPIGAWQVELKRADWPKVSEICCHAIENKCKDMQIAVWLLEARLQLDGFAGIAPCLRLLQGLCEGFWNDIHPVETAKAGYEHRKHILMWLDQKLLPAIRLSALTTEYGTGTPYSWADFELARRNAQLAAMGYKDLEGATPEAIHTALSASPTDDLANKSGALASALAAIDTLNQSLQSLSGGMMPPVGAMGALLTNIRAFLDGELAQRATEATNAPKMPPSQNPEPTVSTIRILHNPRCGKSRSACQILAEKGIQAEVVEYLKTPLSRAELVALVKKLGLPAEKLVRKGEAIFKEHYAGKTLSEDGYLDALAAHPILMERPVVIKGDKAIIARPPENLLEFL